MITALVLAAKFFCETQDVVVNADISRFLVNSKSNKAFDLNTMEYMLCDVLDFELFVSQQQYAKEAAKLNAMIAKAKEEEEAQRQKNKMQLKKKLRQRVFHQETHEFRGIPKSQSQEFFTKA